MANVTKADFIAQVAAQSDTDKATAARVLKAIEETVQATVKKGDVITLTGFLKFERVARKATTARNPQNRDITVKVPAKKVPKITAGAGLKKIVNGETVAPKLAKVAR